MLQFIHMQTEMREVEESQFSSLKKVTPLSKYLAMTLFVVLPFLSGWVGYSYAPEKVIETEKIVFQLPVETPEKTVGKEVLASVLGEVAGGHHTTITYRNNDDQLVEIMDTFKKSAYEVGPVTQTPQEFMLELHRIVLAQDFSKVSLTIPVQGLLSANGFSGSEKEGRSVFSGGTVWSRESISNLVSRESFEDVVNEAKKYAVLIEWKTNPIRKQIINFDHAVQKEATANAVKCTTLEDEVMREDIMSAAIIAKSVPYVTPVEGAEFSKTMYKCSSSWGGHGNEIYIQPTKDGSSYQVLAIQDYSWE